MKNSIHFFYLTNSSSSPTGGSLRGPAHRGRRILLLLPSLLHLHLLFFLHLLLPQHAWDASAGPMGRRIHPLLLAGGSIQPRTAECPSCRRARGGEGVGGSGRQRGTSEREWAGGVGVDLVYTRRTAARRWCVWCGGIETQGIWASTATAERLVGWWWWWWRVGCWLLLAQTLDLLGCLAHGRNELFAQRHTSWLGGSGGGGGWLNARRLTSTQRRRAAEGEHGADWLDDVVGVCVCV